MIDRITYKAKFPTGSFLNEDIGFECSFEHDELTGDNSVLMNRIDILRSLAQQSHKEKYPHLYNESGKPITIEQVPEMQLEREPGLSVESIYSCPDKKTLESYRLLIRGNQELQIAYKTRMKDFENQ